MKTLFLFPLCLLFLLNASGQNKLAIFAGPQVNSAYYKVENVKQNTSMKPGFQAGVTMKVPFENRLFFAPAVFYSMKGYKVDFTRYVFPPDLDAKNNNVTVHTFEIAPMLQFDFSSKPGHMYFKVGPSLDLQLFGQERFESRTTAPVVDRKMKFSYGDYNRYSFNFIGQLGYETSDGFVLFAQYNLGMTSISNADFGPKIFHRVIGLSVGKYLHRK